MNKHNKGMTKTVLGILLLVICMACNDVNEQDYPVLSVDITRQNVPSLFDIFEKIEIIPLETTDFSLIGGAGSGWIFDHHYYILDGLSKSFYCFDEYGKYVRTVAKEGPGPQEYIYVTDFLINENSLTAELLSPFGFLYTYELSGKFVDKVKLPNIVPNYQEIFFLNDSLRLLTSSTDNDVDQLYVYSTQSNTITNSFYRENPAIFNFNPSRLYCYDGSIYYYKPLISKVFKINQYEYEVAYSWDLGALSPEKVKLDSDITSERLTEMFLNAQIKWIYNQQFQNDKYYYTLLRHQEDQKNVALNVFYDKRDNRKFIFERFKEDLVFFPFFWCDEYVLSTSTKYSTFKAVDPSVLDEENRNKLKEMKEDDNPYIIKYYFKKNE